MEDVEAASKPAKASKEGDSVKDSIWTWSTKRAKHSNPKKTVGPKVSPANIPVDRETKRAKRAKRGRQPDDRMKERPVAEVNTVSVVSGTAKKSRSHDAAHGQKTGQTLGGNLSVGGAR